MSFSMSFADAPLVPDHWPEFDTILMCSFESPESSPSPPAKQDTLPSPATLAAMPIPPSRTSPRNKNPDHIPRPRNAFMLFRSAFAASQKISSTIEHDNRHITRIIAHCWNRLSESEKQVWRDRAATEKAQHAQRYPNYRFSPVGRANRRAKRKVRRNGAEDVRRCEMLAELVMEGKFGQELESAIKEIDHERFAAALTDLDHTDMPAAHVRFALPIEGANNVPPFRSPLLPPTTTSLHQTQVPDRRLMPDVPSSVPATTACLEPPAFCSPAMSDGSLDSLLPRNGEPSPRSIPADHFQSIMDFSPHNTHAQLEQPSPDFSFNSWYQSDDFPFYH